jgi:large subunit ribosomal protein L17
MMELADYWLLEKDLVPKLFKVLVPRYDNTMGPYTQVYKLPIVYPGYGKPKIILELKGNPYPPVVQRARDFSQSLTNILISACKNDLKDSIVRN